MTVDDARSRIASVIGATEVARRDTRWLALRDDVVAFAADDAAEWRRLEAERWLIERWRAAGVPAPRVLREDAALGVQVRERLHGRTGNDIHCEHAPSPLYASANPDSRARLDDAPLSPYGARLAESYGELAARIRRTVTVADAAAVGLAETSHRRLDLDAALARLAATHASTAAKAAGPRLRAWLSAIPPVDAVIHGDLHFFNMVTDDTGAITGVFDLGDAGPDAAATELLYVQSLGAQFADRAIAAYGPVDVGDVWRAHVRTALGHLEWHGPGSERHDQIVAWVTAVLERTA